MHRGPTVDNDNTYNRVQLRRCFDEHDPDLEADVVAATQTAPTPAWTRSESVKSM
jgi:hypothetical protein